MPSCPSCPSLTFEYPPSVVTPTLHLSTDSTFITTQVTFTMPPTAKKRKATNDDSEDTAVRIAPRIPMILVSTLQNTNTGRKPTVRWTEAEERSLLDAINAHMAATGGIWSIVKNHPEIGQRSSAGVKYRWDAMVSGDA